MSSVQCLAVVQCVSEGKTISSCSILAAALLTSVRNAPLQRHILLLQMASWLLMTTYTSHLTVSCCSYRWWINLSNKVHLYWKDACRQCNVYIKLNLFLTIYLIYNTQRIQDIICNVAKVKWLLIPIFFLTWRFSWQVFGVKDAWAVTYLTGEKCILTMLRCILTGSYEFSAGFVFAF